MKYIIFLLLFANIQAFSQGIKVPIQVLDIKNNPISGASVDVVGKNASGISDDVGILSLAFPSTMKKGDEVTIRVKKDGYLVSTRHISVSSLITTVKLIKNKNWKSKTVNTTVAPKVDQPNLSQQFNPVTSYYQSGGITAGQINIGPVPRKLDVVNAQKLLDFLNDKKEKINIICISGDSESFQYATEIKDFLVKNDYMNLDGVAQVSYTTPVFGQSAIRDTVKKTVNIIIGSRQ